MFGETSNQTISSRRPTVKMLLKCILTTALLFQKKSTYNNNYLPGTYNVYSKLYDNQCTYKWMMFEIQ